MNERKIIDRKFFADLAKEVGLNASHLEALVAICLNGWLRYSTDVFP